MIGILTFHHTTNYGSLLQTFALYKMLTKFGISCEIIDYECLAIEENEMPLKIAQCTTPKKLLRFLLINRYRKKKLDKFNSFCKQNIKISSVRYNRATICDANSRYDGYIVGSDIIWGLDITNNDFTYFLDFAKHNKWKTAYAASIGSGLIENKQKVQLCLEQFNNISVRESSGKKLIEEFFDTSVQTVLDPTLLFPATFWDQYTAKQQIKEKYILIYFALEPNLVFEKARILAEKEHLKIVYIQDTLRQIPDFINVRTASIGEFLSYIKYAEYIFTGSYHGTVFSINFNKQFLTNNKDYTDRISCILSLLEIEDRDLVKIDPVMNKINYGSVNHKLLQHRKESLAWLEGALKEYDKTNM